MSSRTLPSAVMLVAAMALASCGDSTLRDVRAGGGSGDDLGGGGTGSPPQPLPAGVEHLESGFRIERVAGDLDMPVKLAAAPDGRIFFNELGGRVRIIETDGTLAAEPFATVEVLTGGEQGLLGLALSPGFRNSGLVYVLACVDAPPRQQIIRFRDVDGAGLERTVLVDDLPNGFIHNGGALEFLRDGTLLVSIGDTSRADSAQTDGELAGRVLRYNEDGSIPSNNPISGSPEWCRGLRNTFDLTVHPRTGGVFGLENGPAVNDELNFLDRGKNYGWPSLPGSVPGSTIGQVLHAWPTVIAPTGITFHDGFGFGSEFEDDLFILSYDEAEVLWLQMSGRHHTDLDAIEIFAAFETSGTDHLPLDVVEHEDGSLWVSTFTTIWRIARE